MTVYPRTVDDALRDRFDGLLEQALEHLPERLREVIAEVPLIVDDRPDESVTRSLMAERGDLDGITEAEFADTLCGLHSGVPITESTVEASAEMPTDVRLFREGIVNIAGGWEPQGAETAEDVDDAIYEEIVITILHELGHHFGLEEDDLESLGYA